MPAGRGDRETKWGESVWGPAERETETEMHTHTDEKRGCSFRNYKI